MMESFGESMFKHAFQGRKITVLGASGFVGRWVARRLTAEGADLQLVVRNAADAREIFSIWGVEGKVMEADLSASGAAGEVIGAGKPELLFNLAGYGVDPGEREQQDPALAEKLNASLVEEVATACSRLSPSRWPGQRLIHAGSALEYGLIKGEASEDRKPLPTTLYGRTKLEGTRNLTRVALATGLPAATARLFQVVGPGEHAGRLLPSLLETARPGSQAVLRLSGGAQKLDFSYVEDIAEGLLKLALCKPAKLNGPGEIQPGAVINLASGTMFSVKEFVERSCKILGLASHRMRFDADLKSTSPMQYSRVNIATLILLLRWKPDAKIEDIVRRSVRFAEKLNTADLTDRVPMMEEAISGIRS